MPPITRRFLFTAAALLLSGVSLGLFMLARRELLGIWPAPGLVSAHVHLILVGTVMQLIFGVAWWMFPRPLRTDPQPSETAAQVTWWLLTIGTVARAGGEALAPAGTLPLLVLGGGVLQVGGIIAAVVAL
ncbi:MAG TPA: hypothetical protein PLL69_10215, partial [Gemmatimonadales bacterium]|nr:hypothetical protein [Gemmatimonadales bacterium]